MQPGREHPEAACYEDDTNRQAAAASLVHSEGAAEASRNIWLQQVCNTRTDENLGSQRFAGKM